MNSTAIKSAASFAFAATALAFASAAMAADTPMGGMGKSIGAKDTVHCYNVNECKGMSDCKTAEHACKGQNECKGHGFKALGAGQCLSKGGTISDL